MGAELKRMGCKQTIWHESLAIYQELLPFALPPFDTPLPLPILIFEK
jgi:hypothetical protein